MCVLLCVAMQEVLRQLRPPAAAMRRRNRWLDVDAHNAAASGRPACCDRAGDGRRSCSSVRVVRLSCRVDAQARLLTEAVASNVAGVTLLAAVQPPQQLTAAMACHPELLIQFITQAGEALRQVLRQHATMPVVLLVLPAAGLRLSGSLAGALMFRPPRRWPPDVPASLKPLCAAPPLSLELKEGCGDTLQVGSAVCPRRSSLHDVPPLWHVVGKRCRLPSWPHGRAPVACGQPC